MAQKFSNNSSLDILVALIVESETTLSDVEQTTSNNAQPLATLDAGDHQLATITHADEAGYFEIVKVTQYSEFGGDLVMSRAQEGTTARAWTSGATLTARVTAAMLEGMDLNATPGTVDIRPDYVDPAVAIGVGSLGQVPSKKGLAILKNSRWIEEAWTIAGFPALQLGGEALSGDRINGAATAVEAVFTSGSMELGTVPTWAAATLYHHGDVVAPTTPNGYQYRLEVPLPAAIGMTSGGSQPTVFTSPISLSNPARLDGGAVVDPRAEGVDDADVGGYWTPQHLGNGVYLCIPTGYMRFYPTEIGFVCDKHTASTSPTVTIGSAYLESEGTVAVTDDVDLFANALSLASITGPHMRHRITSLPDVGVLGFVIKLAAAATGGSFHGRFYFKGMFVENLDWLPEP